MSRKGQSSRRVRPPRQLASRPIGEAPEKTRSGRPKAPAPMPLRARWRAVGVGTLISLASQGLYILGIWLIDENGNDFVNFLPITGSLFLVLTAQEVIRRMTSAEWEGRNRMLGYLLPFAFWWMFPNVLGVFGIAVWPMMAFGIGGLFAFGPGNRYNLRSRAIGTVAVAVYALMFFLTIPVVGLAVAALVPYITLAIADRFTERKIWAQQARAAA